MRPVTPGRAPAAKQDLQQSGFQHRGNTTGRIEAQDREAASSVEAPRYTPRCRAVTVEPLHALEQDAETVYLRRTKLIETAVADRRLTDFETRALIAAYARTNSETARLWPSSATLAAAIGGTAPAVRHALGRAVAFGYLIVIAEGGRRGGNKTTVYELPPVIPHVQVRLAPVIPDVQVRDADAATCNPTPTRPVILGVHKPNKEPKEEEGASEIAPKRIKTEPHTEASGSTSIGSSGDRAAAPALPLALAPEKPREPKPDRRPKSRYHAKHGCTIDSYRPGSNIAAWASQHAPLVKGAVTQDTIDEIKDIWRKRGERIVDFDATYRDYIRKRQKWAEQDSARTAASGKPPEHKPRTVIAGSLEARKAYEVEQ